MTDRDKCILRDLAKKVAEIAALPEQAEKVRLWTLCNDLKPERAMVFANPQNGWKELDAAWMRLECEDELARKFEFALQRKLIRHEHIPDDFPILNTFDVSIPVLGAGYEDYGLPMEVERSNHTAGAYHIVPSIKSEDDLAQLHFRPIKIDHESADMEVAIAQEIFGDILNVRKVGKTHWRYGLTRVLIHMRGFDQMLLDMYDNPAILHQLMGFLRDDFLAEIDLFEREGAVSLNNVADNVTGSGGLSPTSDLPAKDYAGTPRVKDCICWAESQETVSVSPWQFEEFVLQYQLPLVKRFGLTDYGCCEPLDQKIDLLIRKIPNLRWVAVVPWCNRELMAEKIGKRFVYVYKPNPARICSPTPDWKGAEDEIRQTLRIAKGCSIHLVMKDTHTFCNEPERITRWAEMARRIAEES